MEKERTAGHADGGLCAQRENRADASPVSHENGEAHEEGEARASQFDAHGERPLGQPETSDAPAASCESPSAPHNARCSCGSQMGAETLECMPEEELLYDLADLFKIFADTTRIKILYSLMGGELAVGDIAEVIGATQSAVSHQLRTLKQAHLVKFRRDGKSVMYSLSDDHVYTMLAQGMSHICE